MSVCVERYMEYLFSIAKIDKFIEFKKIDLNFY